MFCVGFGAAVESLKALTKHEIVLAIANCLNDLRKFNLVQVSGAA